MSMNIPNPFLDCSLPELVEAWKVFSAPRKDGTLDHEAMEWVVEALDRKTYFSHSRVAGANITILMEL
jgi:hypothetical protein